MNENNIDNILTETVDSLLETLDSLIENDILPISFYERLFKFSEKEAENDKSIHM